ncbi:hypothetical protein [Absidia glauca]|uniref:DUF1764 domain-containing protein n=1 Tax=Absidia glauca TaxID=4829 RepID=A0A163KIB8_ABSGL|nr:hypothetical protein [Absidia glauca]
MAKTNHSDKATQPKDTKSNEIDDIFATKKIVKDAPTQEEPAPLTKQQKRKQKKKAAVAEEEETKAPKEDGSEDEEDEHKVQEVIFAQLAAAKNLKRKAQPPPPTSMDDDQFGDSRGKKAKRTTDDGYPLYDVKDLRIGEGQDTPECPFDCQCCF